MICQRCGTYMQGEVLTCDHCGSLLTGGSSQGREAGVRGMRQGRLAAIPPVLPDEPRASIPEYGDYDMSPLPLEEERSPRRKVAQTGLSSFASRPTTRRGVPVNPRGRSRGHAAHHVRMNHVKRHPVNWMLLGIIGTVLAVVLIVGYFVYMRGTDAGQRMTARQLASTVDEPVFALLQSEDPLLQVEKEEALKELNGAPSQSYWLVGQDYMDAGDVETAIHTFRVADILDPDNYDGLLLLANAYELDAQDAKAEETYLRLAGVDKTEDEEGANQTEEIIGIAPSRPEAYTALIRMYLDQGRNPEAANMMLNAYTKTDRETFRLQRKDFIPQIPQVDVAAGRYMLNKTIQLTSPQGYDIYYTLDNSVELPKLGNIPEGWIYTDDGTMTLTEGTLTLRAFCLSENLVSDPLSVTYTIYFPTPSAPGVNLAPGTYTKARTVLLRPGSDEDKKEHKDYPLKFYYTIDGSTPTEESPEFDGTPIQLPSGRVTIKAIAVNRYGKMSAPNEVGYKFDIKPAPLPIYAETDKFDGFTIYRTTMEEFTGQFGEPLSQAETKYLYREEDAVQLEYSWGHAAFLLSEGKWVLVRVDMDREIAAGPRSVGFGSSESEITAVYKDMGQLQAPNGNRGLYYADPDIGRIIQNEDGTRTVQYSCSSTEGRGLVLQYHLQNGKVVRIAHYYQP